MSKKHPEPTDDSVSAADLFKYKRAFKYRPPWFTVRDHNKTLPVFKNVIYGCLDKKSLNQDTHTKIGLCGNDTAF